MLEITSAALKHAGYKEREITFEQGGLYYSSLSILFCSASPMHLIPYTLALL
jgi:hypothetical protein